MPVELPGGCNYFDARQSDDADDVVGLRAMRAVWSIKRPGKRRSVNQLLIISVAAMWLSACDISPSDVRFRPYEPPVDEQENDVQNGEKDPH